MVVEIPGTLVRIVFIDFSKAFDRVNHHILLGKLREHEVPEFIVSWLASFLCNRNQRVKIGNIQSNWCHIKAGVPQGTLIGPVAFLIHINDLQTCVNNIKYVDDASMWEGCHVSGIDSHLQEAADETLAWADKNDMGVNTDKTKYMEIYFGRKDLALAPITMNGSEIDKVQVFKLLGVHVNDRLTWHEHIDYICSKASRRIYFLILLKRAGKSSMDIVDTYVSIVRSILEYACIVWHPGLTKYQSEQIEHIQKRCLNIAHPDLSYDDALIQSNLERLVDRRENMCKKFFTEIQDPDHKLHYLLPPPRDYVRLRHYRKYEPPKSKTERVKRSVINYALYNYQ